MAQASLPNLERAFEMLADDAFRQGGTLSESVVLRVCEKLKLDVVQLVEIKRRLVEEGVEMEGAADSSPEPPPESPEVGPSEGDVASVARQFQDEVRKFDLLTKEEETALMRRIRAGEAATRALTDGTNDTALEETVADGRRARERFLNSNLRLVAHMARRLNRGTHLHLDDLIQEGNIGLMRAVEKFDHQRGLKFSTYATWWIFQGITRALADKNRLVRIPVHMQERARKVRRLQATLAREAGGKPPDVYEIAEHLKWLPEKVQFLLDLALEPLSLDAPMNHEEGATTIGETIAEPDGRSPEDVAVGNELRRDVDKALAGLPPRQSEILQRRFRKEETLEQIGQAFEVTRERIRQIESKALKTLRHPRRARQLAEHVDEPSDDEEESE